jgi:hypothetical protein
MVSVRARSWTVTDITIGQYPTDEGRLKPSLKIPSGHSLVTVSSLEDDSLGEELQVVWELEPGARVIEKVALPEPSGFDPPTRLDAFLDAVRWGAASSADLQNIQAPFRAGIDIEDYQLDPLLRAIAMPRVNLLIADDVGLGKTIEAGLVALELLLRHRARRMLVVCTRSARRLASPSRGRRTSWARSQVGCGNAPLSLAPFVIRVKASSPPLATDSAMHEESRHHQTLHSPSASTPAPSSSSSISQTRRSPRPSLTMDDSRIEPKRSEIRCTAIPRQPLAPALDADGERRV